ncbi:MAG: VOC family protein [Gammaproteobacteria bacterium]|nr:VOC family protein [Gammaproteobacteria bacterium]
MNVEPAIWGARLDHFVLHSARPDELLRFYEQALGLEVNDLGNGRSALAGRERMLIIDEGVSECVPEVGFGFADAAQLSGFRTTLEARGMSVSPANCSELDGPIFSVMDPDGLRLLFGISPSRPVREGLAGRLQHIVFATPDTTKIVDFYQSQLGFVVSDWVVNDDEEATAVFFRSDPEHHSYATFRAPQARFDHFALETSGWMDLRDWGDHFASMRVPVWWGPGRHGPGNNLFMMVRDPDGNRIEISAEIESMNADVSARTWPHEERTVNLWGAGWMRS